MQRLWRSHAPDEQRVVSEYAAHEEAGEVARSSNRVDIPPLEYARRLLNDGLRKGWLDGAIRAPTARPVRVVAPRIAATTAIPTTEGLSRRQWATEAMGALGAEPESPEYLERVRAWREAWRPSRVRVLLVAESHVAEQPGDGEVSVHLPDISRPAPPLPDGYCRLVYCLGYGETPLCSPRPPSGNGGTWQYWHLFGAVASAYDATIPAAMPRRDSSDLRTRLDWKLRVLATLQRAGVWLEDASIVALYSPGGGRRATGGSYDRVVRTSFEGFVWPAVVADQPEQVWVVGRAVGRALQGLPGIEQARVISQPQDRDQTRFRADLARLRSELPGSFT